LRKNKYHLASFGKIVELHASIMMLASIDRIEAFPIRSGESSRLVNNWQRFERAILFAVVSQDLLASLFADSAAAISTTSAAQTPLLSADVTTPGA
jgi:hypothetical protein